MRLRSGVLSFYVPRMFGKVRLRSTGWLKPGRLTGAGAPRTRLSICSTCAIGVSGRMPWPRLKMNGPSPSASMIASTAAVERRAAGAQAPADRDCPAPAAAAATLRAQEQIGDHPVEADRSRCRSSRIAAAAIVPAPRGKPMISAPGHFLAHAARRSRCVGIDAPAIELVRRQHARPGVEDLHGIGAGLELAHEIIDRASTSRSISIGERSRHRDRRTAAPAPDRACRGPRSCRSRPSRARRKIRAARSAAGSSDFTRRTVS